MRGTEEEPLIPRIRGQILTLTQTGRILSFFYFSFPSYHVAWPRALS